MNYKETRFLFEEIISFESKTDRVFFGGGVRTQNLETRLFALSLRPRAATRLPPDGFSRNLIFEDFSKTCRENSSVIKM